jgi:hypothetical protein
MTSDTKTLLRAAALVHEHLLKRNVPMDFIRLPEYSWQQIQRVKRQVLLADARGWHSASTALFPDLVDNLERLQYEVSEVLAKARVHCHDRRAAGIADIFRDLRALRQEFADLEIDFSGRELAVTTDAIVLEEIDFGRFQICLDLRQIGGVRQPYRIVALDPCPAARNASVTHPHVQDEHLCEGEGLAAIAAALRDGRLYDYFTLVSQVLRTYGRGNAYVELDQWFGAVCEECGDTTDEDDSCCCQQCDSRLCSSCAVSCQGCQDSYCSECRRSCVACDGDYCSSCLTLCRVCRKRYCSACLMEGLCPACHRQTHEKDQDHDSCDDPACEDSCLVEQSA